MSFLLRQVAHCDVCGHEWLVVADKVPSHCAKCKSRKWNQSPIAAEIAEHKYWAANPEKGVIGATKRTIYPGTKHAKTCKCLMCKPPK